MFFFCSRPGVSVPHDLVSRPPSYRSRASDAPVPIHGRHPSQLSYLSTHSVVVEQAVVEEAEQDKDHASVVPVPGNNVNNKSSIKIEAGELDDYMNDFQERIETIGCKTDNMVTIVQNNGESKVVTSPGHHPVIVTVSGSLDSDSVIKSPEMDILAHL